MLLTLSDKDGPACMRAVPEDFQNACVCGETRDPVLISDNRRISWSLEATRWAVSFWNLTGTSVAMLPRRLSHLKAIGQFQKLGSYTSLRYGHGTLVRFLSELYPQAYIVQSNRFVFLLYGYESVFILVWIGLTQTGMHLSDMTKFSFTAYCTF